MTTAITTKGTQLAAKILRQVKYEEADWPAMAPETLGTLSLLCRHAVTVGRCSEMECSGAPEWALKGLTHPARERVNRSAVEAAEAKSARLMSRMNVLAETLPPVNGRPWRAWLNGLYPVIITDGLPIHAGTTNDGPYDNDHGVFTHAAFCLMMDG